MKRRYFIGGAAALAASRAVAQTPPQAGFATGAYTPNTFRPERLGMQPLQVGGVKIGTVGATGSIYENYILSAGEDFTGPLDVFDATQNPNGRYLSTRVDLVNQASMTSRNLPGRHGYYMDPYTYGDNDAARGVRNIFAVGYCVPRHRLVP